MVNPVTVCRVHLRQKEAANGMQEHADLVSKKDRKNDPLLFPHSIMEDNKRSVRKRGKCKEVGRRGEVFKWVPGG